MPLLHLFGLTLGGWLIVTQAAKAIRALGEGGDESFLRSKVAFARYYAAQVLPHAEAFFTSATLGSSEVAQFDAALV